jgi:phage shock protein A
LWKAIGRSIRRLLANLFGRPQDQSAARIRALQEDFEEKLGGSKQSLARLAATVGRLEVRLDSNRQRAEELRKRRAAYQKVGKADLAGEIASELAGIEVQLEGDARELSKTQALLKASRQSLDRLQREFEQKLGALERLRSEVEVKELQAQLAAMVGQAARSAEDSKAALDALQNDLEARHDRAAGRVRVALDLADHQD